jgi:hypothetical protein
LQRQLLRRGIDGGHAPRRSTCVCSCAYQLHARSCIFEAAAPQRAQRAQHLQRTACYCSRIRRCALFLFAGHLSITLCITDMDDWAHHLLVNAVPLRLCNNQAQLTIVQCNCRLHRRRRHLLPRLRPSSARRLRNSRPTFTRNKRQLVLGQSDSASAMNDRTRWTKS